MKPKIGIYGFSGCWGEQIVILNCEDELLDIFGAVDIVDFLGGSSVNDTESRLLIAFVEGSIANAREEASLRKIRERTDLLIACGSCACFGGVAAMDARAPRAEVIKQVYGMNGPAGSWDIGPHRPLSDFVKVDLCIPGCPIEKTEFLRVVSSLLNGDAPVMPEYPVCVECKMKENECLLLRGLPCAGPVTRAGCDARCPSYNIACVGCRGPVEEANMSSLENVLQQKKFTLDEIKRKLRTFAAPVMDKMENRG
ncbi:MAG: NADH:ubiquinone oxidoreductase [Acidobacteria bacterium]|nr:NADH:ubiquinone oxidoreductase [Acidobacteriota bacterium]